MISSVISAGLLLILLANTVFDVIDARKTLTITANGLIIVSEGKIIEGLFT
jgi:hypothetical protein